MTSSSSSESSTLEERRNDIFQAALTFVPEFGWTDDALAKGVLHAGYPPATIGLVSSSGGAGELVSFFMDTCAQQLHQQLQKQQQQQSIGTYEERLEHAIRTRLEMCAPLVRSKRWHEGMATGSLQAPTTAEQLEHLCRIFQQYANSSNNEKDCMLERTAIGSIYIATELHMLMDDDTTSFASTWQFLNQRVQDFASLQQQQQSSMSPEITTAATAVISSLGGAAVSLLQPAAKLGVGTMASTVVPLVMNIMPQSQSNMHPGTKAQDYISRTKNNDSLDNIDLSDLPPFDTEEKNGIHK